MTTIKYMKDPVNENILMKEHNLSWMDIYKLKSNNVGGSFTLDNLKYDVVSDEKKKSKKSNSDNSIELPAANNEGHKVKFLITDVVDDNNMPAKNTYHTELTIFDERMTLKDFYERIGISKYTLRNATNSARSFYINGVFVRVHRVCKK